MTPSDTGTDPSVFFGDARECKAWLGSLAVSSPAQSLSAMLDAVRVFNRAEFDPLERLKCLELLRDRNAFMLAELRTRHFSKALPLGSADASAWNTALAVVEEMEAGYRKCLTEGALDAHAALIAQRMIRYIGAQMLLHSAVYKPVEGALWSRLHQVYAAAEKAGYAADKVKDSLEGDTGSSVMEAYARVVLMQATGLGEMTPAQVLFTEAVLRLWMRKVQVLDRAPEEPATAFLPIVVDLAQSRGAEATMRDALGSTQRVIDAEGLSRSVRRRLRALNAGEDVGTLGLPPEVSAVDPAQTLQRLAKRWSEPAPRPGPTNAPSSPVAGLVFGLPDIHFFLSGGKAFEQPGKQRELTHQEKNDIAVFGRVTERTQSVMAAAGRTQAGMSPMPTMTVEPWDVVDESIDGVRLRRRSSATKTVAVGRLVAVRLGDTAPFIVGVVRELANEPEGIVMAVATIPGRPQPTAARGANPSWSQALSMPALEKAGIPRTLIVAGGLGHRGRPIHYWEENAQQGKVLEVVERGADFDRITLA